MKKFLPIYFLILIIFTLLITPSCKTFVWDPTGTWTVTVTFPSWGNWTYTEHLSFTGNDSAGSVSGMTMDGFSTPLTGTYSKTSDFIITFKFELHNNKDYVWEFIGTSSEDSSDKMTGTGIFEEDGLPTNFTFTGTKT